MYNFKSAYKHPDTYAHLYLGNACTALKVHEGEENKS